MFRDQLSKQHRTRPKKGLPTDQISTLICDVGGSWLGSIPVWGDASIYSLRVATDGDLTGDLHVRRMHANDEAGGYSAEPLEVRVAMTSPRRRAEAVVVSSARC